MLCPACEEDTGLLLGRVKCAPGKSPCCHRGLVGSEVNVKLGKEDSNTGSLSSTTRVKSVSVLSRKLFPERIWSSPDRSPLKTMSGRKTPESKVPALNSVSSPFKETVPKIGKKSGTRLNPEQSNRFQLMFEFDGKVTLMLVIIPCVEYAETIRDLLQWNVSYTFSGVQQGLVNQEEPGKRLVWKLTQRIPARSFGAVIKVKNMLSSMNFEEESTFPIFCDGWIGIQSSWKQRDPQCVCVPKLSGSPRTSIRGCGIPNLTALRMTR